MSNERMPYSSCQYRARSRRPDLLNLAEAEPFTLPMKSASASFGGTEATRMIRHPIQGEHGGSQPHRLAAQQTVKDRLDLGMDHPLPEPRRPDDMVEELPVGYRL